MTLELGSMEGITLTGFARPPFSFPLNVGLELEQFHRKIIKDKDKYQSSIRVVSE